MAETNTNISAENRKALADGLSRALADSYTLYLKTHNFHWNVEGPGFQGLHNLFEKQYTDLAEAIDDVAERIRALGHYAPGSFTEFAQLASVKEQTQKLDSRSMLRELAEDQDTIVATMRKVIKTAQEAEDPASEDLMVSRIQAHEKNAWMLRAYLA